MVAFGEFRGDELVENLGGLFQRYGIWRLGADSQVVAVPVIGEGDDESLRLGFDGGMVFVVKGSLAEVEGSGLDGWWFQDHGGAVDSRLYRSTRGGFSDIG